MLRALLVALALALLSPTASAAEAAEPPSPPSLDGLLARFAKVPGLEARFVEHKHMALLAAPLRSEGTLYYARPGHLARHTTKPAPSVLIVEPDRVRFGDGRKVETIDLGGRPVVRMFVESFVKILHGDRAALERLYAIELQERPASEPASEGRWSLALTPLVSPMNKVFARIELEGQRMDLASMTMIELDGDKTVTTFSDVDTARQFSAEEHARVFSVAPAP